MTVFLAECLYCGHGSHTATEAEYHVCEPNALAERFDAVCAESEKWRRALQVELCQNAPLRKQNADLLAALKIALPYVESFDDDNADLQTKANASTVRAAIARATGSEVEK